MRQSVVKLFAVNNALSDSPELVNESPYQEGWIFRIKMTDDAQLADLIDAQGYLSMIAAEE
ncbi:Glycine cleavage system H protein [Providencia rustigianii]|nr:Glycine cleavage system H protein [Providencia rustigianii]